MPTVAGALARAMGRTSRPASFAGLSPTVLQSLSPTIVNLPPIGESPAVSAPPAYTTTAALKEEAEVTPVGASEGVKKKKKKKKEGSAASGSVPKADAASNAESPAAPSENSVAGEKVGLLAAPEKQSEAAATQNPIILRAAPGPSDTGDLSHPGPIAHGRRISDVKALSAEPLNEAEVAVSASRDDGKGRFKPADASETSSTHRTGQSRDNEDSPDVRPTAHSASFADAESAQAAGMQSGPAGARHRHSGHRAVCIRSKAWSDTHGWKPASLTRYAHRWSCAVLGSASK